MFCRIEDKTLSWLVLLLFVCLFFLFFYVCDSSWFEPYLCTIFIHLQVHVLPSNMAQSFWRPFLSSHNIAKNGVLSCWLIAWPWLQGKFSPTPPLWCQMPHPDNNRTTDVKFLPPGYKKLSKARGGDVDVSIWSIHKYVNGVLSPKIRQMACCSFKMTGKGYR